MFKIRPWATLPIVWPLFIISIAAGITLSSCVNPEGLGGTGSITGTITEYSYNDDYSALIYQGAAVDEEVFILFGEDEALGNRVRTGITGEFRFKYLYPGNYYIYFRSQDSTEIPDDGWNKMVKVNLDNGEDAELGELVKLNTVEYDDGAALVKGIVKKIKYVDESRWPNLVPEYVDFAHEHEVYLTYGDHAFYDERVREVLRLDKRFRPLYIMPVGRRA